MAINVKKPAISIPEQLTELRGLAEEKYPRSGGTIAGSFGCNGADAQTEATVNAASTDLSTVVALCNQLRAALIANGIAV